MPRIRKNRVRDGIAGSPVAVRLVTCISVLKLEQPMPGLERNWMACLPGFSLWLLPSIKTRPLLHFLRLMARQWLKASLEGTCDTDRNRWGDLAQGKVNILLGLER